MTLTTGSKQIRCLLTPVQHIRWHWDSFFKYVNATHDYLDIVTAIAKFNENIDKKLPNENTRPMLY